MRQMIQQIRDAFPFELGEDQLCTDTCSVGCPLKLLEYMEQEVLSWRLASIVAKFPPFEIYKRWRRVVERFIVCWNRTSW